MDSNYAWKGRKMFEYDQKIGGNQIRPELIAYPCLFTVIALYCTITINNDPHEWFALISSPPSEGSFFLGIIALE